MLLCFCFKQKTAYEMRISDWSSVVCSSDLKLLGLLGQVAGQVERPGDEPAVMRHDPGGGIDGEGDDFLRGLVGDLLDVHAALGRDHEGDAPGGRSEEHTSELLSLMRISYAVFCLKKKNIVKYQ